MDRDVKAEYEDLINSNKVFLFMKGSPEVPQCGFSFRVVNLLANLEVEFKSFDILQDSEMREGVKEFANWPTYPQLYVNGKLIGGCEIVEEMHRNGELDSIL